MPRKKNDEKGKRESLELLIGLIEATKKIEKRIENGKRDLREITISTPIELDAVKVKYRSWDEYNELMLRQMFSIDELAKDYALSIVMGPSERLSKSQDFQWHVDKKIEMLESFLERLELIPLSENLAEQDVSTIRPNSSLEGKNIFIGHGQTRIWKDLKDFLEDRLELSWSEFNRISPAGIATTERLSELLDGAGFAFLIFTAEDEQADETLHARENVIHEAGLFQGRIGFKKAIILLEEDCKEFSNIHGLGQIRFPSGDISAKFEEIRQVLEREGIL